MNLRRLAAALTLTLHAAAQSPTVITISPKVTGSFNLAMSTSFQAAPWTDPTFLAHPEIPALLNQLNPHHIRVQVIDKSIPETAPGVWDYKPLDRQLQPILSVADHSPELQLANAPAYLYRSKADFVTPAFIAGYAAYAAGMVRHYNAPGRPHPIHYWGILNEPNYFHISPAEYVQLYNAAVPAMLALDPTIKIVALELGGEPEDERAYLPTFVRNVTAQVDILGIHFYSTCDRRDSDQTLLATIPSFVEQVQYLRAQLQSQPQTRDTVVWVMENNVNGDFVGNQGESACNSGQKFAPDTRGSSSFFVAWRAYEFSQFAKAGVEGLYHWVFTGDSQLGEINTDTKPARLQRSYWIDFWLGRYFPPNTPAQVLSVTNPDPENFEVLAAILPGRRILIMIANHAVAHPEDNVGSGLRLPVTLDLSALGPFNSTNQLTFDGCESSTRSPIETQRNPAPRVDLTVSGYGVTFISLQ